MLTYPISKDKAGVYWMSNKDITKALGYKVEATIQIIAKKHSKEFTEPSSATRSTIGAVRTICKYSRHTSKARYLSDHLLQFAQQQIKGEDIMLKKIQTRPYPIYKDTQGTLLMSEPDLTELFKYNSPSGLRHVANSCSNPSILSNQGIRFYTLNAVSQFCQKIGYKRYWVNDLAEYLKTLTAPTKPVAPVTPSYKQIAEDLRMVVAHSKTPADAVIQFIIQDKGVKNPVNWIKSHGYPTQIGEFNVEYLDFKLDWSNLGKSSEYKDNLATVEKLSYEMKACLGRRNKFLVDQLCEAYSYMMGVEALAAFRQGNGVA